MKRDVYDDGYDTDTAHEILLRSDANARKHEALMNLRRELRDLCRQAIMGGLTNLEAFAVLAQLAPRGLLATESIAMLDTSRLALEAFDSPNSEVLRLCALASDAFKDAIRAVGADIEPAAEPQRKTA